MIPLLAAVEGADPVPYLLTAIGALCAVIVYQERRSTKREEERLKREETRSDTLAKIVNSFVRGPCDCKEGQTCERCS